MRVSFLILAAACAPDGFVGDWVGPCEHVLATPGTPDNEVVEFRLTVDAADDAYLVEGEFEQQLTYGSDIQTTLLVLGGTATLEGDRVSLDTETPDGWPVTGTGLLAENTLGMAVLIELPGAATQDYAPPEYDCVLERSL